LIQKIRAIKNCDKPGDYAKVRIWDKMRTFALLEI
jgi:hypothetical protein